MPVLEVRRHSMRTKPGQHLSQEGVYLARLVGKELGPFDLVVSSDLPRAIETAVAMGFAVDDVIAELGTNLPERLFSLISWPRPIQEVSEIVRDDEECLHYAHSQAAHWRSVLRQLADNQAALIITHGAIIELGAIGFVSDADHSAWGAAIGYCEGFRFNAQGADIKCDVLRLSPELQVIEN